MERKRQSRRVSLDNYLDFDSAAEADAYEADAVIDEGEESYIDIDKFDKFALKKLDRLKRKAINANSLEAIKEYWLYANEVFYSKDEYICFIIHIWNWDEGFKSNLRQDYNCAKVNYRELFEHYAIALDLWLNAEDNAPMPVEKEDG